MAASLQDTKLEDTVLSTFVSKVSDLVSPKKKELIKKIEDKNVEEKTEEKTGEKK